MRTEMEMDTNSMILKKKQTPIEIAMDIDEEGHTTAKKLYEWLELRPADYSRWIRINITDNVYAENGVDYSALRKKTSEQGGRPTNDYLLSASFAKKLAMKSRSSKGEEAREYFLKVERALVKVATKPMTNAELALWSAQILVDQERKMRELEDRQTGIEDRQIGIEDRQIGLEERQIGIEDRQAGLEERQTEQEYEIKEINAQLATHPVGWYTIAGYASKIGMSIDVKTAGALGMRARKLSNEYGKNIQKTPDPRFGVVNVYCPEVLEEVFSEYC